MQRPGHDTKVIYIPEEGMPIIVPRSHIYAREILDVEFEYIELPSMSGYNFLCYYRITGSTKRNQWISNIYKGAQYNICVQGPVLAVVTYAKDQVQSGITTAKAGDLATPGSLHLQLLHDAVYSDAKSRASILALKKST